MGARIDIDHVTCRVRGAGGPCILEGVDQTIAAGECIAIMGASGVGKTTLLRAIVGQLPLADGEIRIDGRPISKAQDTMSYLPQSGGIFPWLTVSEHLRLRDSWDKEQGAALAKQLKMESAADTYAADLSGGERKRLALILVLLNAEDTAVLDEPFSGLDVDLRQRAMDAIGSMHRQKGLTTVFVSHAAEECASLCSRVLYLKGRPARFLPELVLARPVSNELAQPIEQIRERLEQALLDEPA